MKPVTITRRLGLLLCVIILSFGFTAGLAQAKTITFWMMNYEDPRDQVELLQQLTQEFKEETGIEVRYEIINWAQARNKLTLASTGGEAPDVSDMFWAYTFSDMGAGKYGPMPIESAVEKGLFGDIDKRWYQSALKDVRYKGHIYGLPWRIDIRPLAYRKDFVDEAGLGRAPETWDELVTWGKKLTVRDASGRVLRWGVGMAGDRAQFFYNWIWQAGGSFMNEGYTKATLDSPQGREALQFLVDLIHKHKIAPVDYVDPSFDGYAEFAAGKIAILPVGHSSLGQVIERTAPQLVGKVVAAPPLKYRTRDTFQGAGFFGAMYGTKDKDAAWKWLAFLTRDENMEKLNKVSATLSPNVVVSQSPMYTSHWWLKGVVSALPYGRTTQHPHPAWGQITLPEPGGPIYDMMVSALSGRVSVEAAITRAQREMERLMARF